MSLLHFCSSVSVVAFTFMNSLNTLPCVKSNHALLRSALTLAWNVLVGQHSRFSPFTNGALLGSRD